MLAQRGAAHHSSNSKTEAHYVWYMHVFVGFLLQWTLLPARCANLGQQTQKVK
jgi:hypothetical protein